MLSVLMSVYKKDNPKQLKVALESIFENQELKPTEIVLIKDGPLTIELDMTIAKWQSKNIKNVKIVTVELTKNVGLGEALRIGLEYCSSDIVARMDSDDISLPNRFRLQYDKLKNDDSIVLLGGAIEEFIKDENHICSRRIAPLSYEEILKFAKKRNPINHVTVMFKKEAIKKVGSYETMYGFEDFYLWIKLLHNGYKIENIPQVLLKVRLGEHFLERRSGWQYAKYEYRFFKHVYLLGFITHMEFMKLISMRTPLRMLPKSAMKIVYKLLRQK